MKAVSGLKDLMYTAMCLDYCDWHGIQMGQLDFQRQLQADILAMNFDAAGRHVAATGRMAPRRRTAAGINATHGGGQHGAPIAIHGTTKQEGRWTCEGAHVKRTKTKRIKMPNGSWQMKAVEARCEICRTGNCTVCGIGNNCRVRVQYCCDRCIIKGEPVYLCKKHGCYATWHKRGLHLNKIDS